MFTQCSQVQVRKHVNMFGERYEDPITGPTQLLSLYSGEKVN